MNDAEHNGVEKHARDNAQVLVHAEQCGRNVFSKKQCNAVYDYEEQDDPKKSSPHRALVAAARRHVGRDAERNIEKKPEVP
jgi:hypothetical protein